MKELFAYFEKFQRLSPSEKRAITAICTIKKVQKNEIIAPFGQTCKTIYFLKTGLARIFYYKDGIEVTEFFAPAGQLVARVKSLLTQKVSHKAIQMLEAGTLIVINAIQFFKLFDTFPKIERLFRLILEASYVETVRRHTPNSA